MVSDVSAQDYHGEAEYQDVEQNGSSQRSQEAESTFLRQQDFSILSFILSRPPATG